MEMSLTLLSVHLQEDYLYLLLILHKCMVASTNNETNIGRKWNNGMYFCFYGIALILLL